MWGNVTSTSSFPHLLLITAPYHTLEIGYIENRYNILVRDAVNISGDFNAFYAALLKQKVSILVFTYFRMQTIFTANHLFFSAFHLTQISKILRFLNILTICIIKPLHFHTEVSVFDGHTE